MIFDWMMISIFLSVASISAAMQGDDKPVEEICESAIFVMTGRDIDVTPHSFENPNPELKDGR